MVTTVFVPTRLGAAENHLIHDVHTKQSDLIDAEALERKLDDIRNAPVLNICYAGRLDPMKAPMEWLGAIATACDFGAQIEGYLVRRGAHSMDEAKAEAQRLRLDDIVSFPGFVANRAELLGHVRSAHALVFTHITPESPRNLLEALVSGTPILGYDNPYAVNLLEARRRRRARMPTHELQSAGARSSRTSRTTATASPT